MPERMYGPVLLMAAFFGCVVLLMVLLAPVLWSSVDSGQSTTESDISTVFAEEMAWNQWEPDAYTVTDESQTPAYNYVQCVEFDSPGGDEHPLHAALIRNATWPYERDTADYWAVWQHYGWLGIERATEFISYDEIENAWSSDDNRSEIVVELRYTMLLIFWVDNLTGEETIRDRLDNNLYNVSAGANATDEVDSLSAWTMIGKIMTFRMPGTNIVTNALIAIPIYTVLLYMAFAIIRSVIPLLGG